MNEQNGSLNDTTRFYSTLASSRERTKPKRNTRARKSTVKFIVVVFGVILLAALGILVSIGAYNVIRQTPQEKLAAQHDEDEDGPFPLRALVFDTRRGEVREVAAEKTRDTLLDDAAAYKNSADATQYILLIHGLKSTAELWLPTVEQWSRRASSNVIFVLPDLLGHGQSPWPRKKRHDLGRLWRPREATRLDPARHVASLRALLERLVPRGASLHIAGHSLGAIVALELAANLLRYAPVNSVSWSLKTLTLMSTPYFRSVDEAERAAHRHSFWFRHQFVAHACCGYLFCRQNWLWQHALRKKFHRLYPKLPHSVFKAALQHSHHGIHSCLQHSIIEHRAQAAAKIVRDSALPTLLIDGDQDRLCTESRLSLAHDLAPYCTAVLLHDASHSFVARRIDDTVHHFRTFVEAAVAVAIENEHVGDSDTDMLESDP